MVKDKIKFTFILAAILSCRAATAGDNTKYVNMFLGTAGDHGQVTPAAQVPFGLASVCPDAAKPWHAGYDYEQEETTGVSVTRISGVGGNGTGGNLRILPAAKGTTVRIVKGSETAVPGFYGATLDNGVELSLTATANTAIEQYEFPEENEKILTLDVNSAIDPRRSDCRWNILGDRDIEGWVKSSTVANFGAYTLHFHLHSSEPFETTETGGAIVITGVDGNIIPMKFASDVKKVEIRIALSPIDAKTAADELGFIAGKSFKQIRKEASGSWKDILSRVDVKGSTEEQKTLFYTSMYRVFLSPLHACSNDGRYHGTDGQIHECNGWTYYSGWSMWDTYRTKFPMICILAPEQMRDICRSLTSLFCTGKRNWATMNECVPTVRTEHSQLTLLDAWRKGIRDFDLAAAFPGMEKEFEDGLAPRSRQGLTRNAPDQKMETVYDIWALSQIAGIIGDKTAEEKYRNESGSLFEQTWNKEFKTVTDKFSLMKGNGMYQGTRWQYRWAMPVYADRMIELKGRETLAAELSEFFARHLFNQGNEPDIQTPFMFNLFGHPERTDSLVNALLTDDKMVHLYGGNAEYPEPFVGRAFRNKLDGYAPEMDEDDGTMSAWYMFCQMGFYPLCTGTDKYELFTPLFSKIRFDLPTGKVTIRRKTNKTETARILVDGQPLEGRTISHRQLFGAREIVFE